MKFYDENIVLNEEMFDIENIVYEENGDITYPFECDVIREYFELLGVYKNSIVKSIVIMYISDVDIYTIAAFYSDETSETIDDENLSMNNRDVNFIKAMISLK